MLLITYETINLLLEVQGFPKKCFIAILLQELPLISMLQAVFMISTPALVTVRDLKNAFFFYFTLLCIVQLCDRAAALEKDLGILVYD